MITSRLMAPLLGCIVINLNLTTCRSPGESEQSAPPAPTQPAVLDLPGVETKDLTAREKSLWSSLVSEVLTPCENVPGTLAECISGGKSCAACVPAANYLVKQVRAGLTKPQAEVAFRARFARDQVKPIDLLGSPSQGPTDAPITIVEWADFECPACRAATPAIDAVIQANPDVRFVFKNFPLEMHQNAEGAARSAVAAGKQGKFWEMHHALFMSEEPLTQARLTALAKSLNLDLVQFEKDLRSEAVVDAVNRDKKQGRDVELSATPTLFVNGRRFHYTTDLSSELGEWLNLERSLLGAPAPKK